MHAAVTNIEYALPEGTLTNEDLSREYPDWPPEKIQEKTGIRVRHIAAPDECSSDLGVRAAERLFETGCIRRGEVDFLLFCTQSPDYFLPTTACIMQERLGLPREIGALDFNLGCSGFVYGLSLAKGLIETSQARNVVLVTGETYSKYLNKRDHSVRTIFGDAGTATLIKGCQGDEPAIGPFCFGTDGSGAENLIVHTGGCRKSRSAGSSIETTDASGNSRSQDDLFMNGPEIFTFTLSRIPHAVESVLGTCKLKAEDVDLFVFHQANRFMLDHLRKKMRIPEEKFFVSMENVGNTVSSSIPIALRDALEAGRISKGTKILLAGFGVGYSWSVCMLNWLA